LSLVELVEVLALPADHRGRGSWGDEPDVGGGEGERAAVTVAAGRDPIPRCSTVLVTAAQPYTSLPHAAVRMLLSQRLKPRRCPRRRAGIEAGFALCFLPTARRSARLHEAVAAVPFNYSLPTPNPNTAKPVPAPPGDGRPTPLLIPSPHSGTHRVSQLRVSSWRPFIEVHRNFILP